MIEILIALLIALSTDTACELGTEVNWYDWAAEHGKTADRFMTLETDDDGDVWVYKEEDGDYLIFVFMEDIDEVLEAGRSDPHGECAVWIENPNK